MNKRSMLLLSFLLALELYAQQINPHNTEWMQFLGTMISNQEEENEESESANLFDELSYLSEHPFNVNALRKDDLDRLPFLSEVQKEEISYYLYKYAPLLSLYELKNIPELDFQTLTYLLPFLYLGEAESRRRPWKSVFKYAKQEVILRSDLLLQEKAGYKNEDYLGEPYYLSARYAFKAGDRFLVNFSAEKDAGEPLWNAHHKGFDFYAFNACVKEVGVLKSLHVGDYRLAYGQGLIFNTGFSLGKASTVSSVYNRAAGIQRHSSTYEDGFFRGIAGRLAYKSVTLDLFYSARKHSARSDSTEIFSFKNDGYHRTALERNRRHTEKVNLKGTHIQWQKNSLWIGATAVMYDFDGKTLNPEPAAYNQFYLRGKSHYNLGINYYYYDRAYSIQGEVATDKNKKWAHSHRLNFHPGSVVQLSVGYRNYSKGYNSLYGKALGESSRVQNERGVFLGGKFNVHPQWVIDAYADYFHFPWLRYGVGAPSQGYDYMVQANFFTGNRFKMNWRLRHKEKEKNSTHEGEKSPVVQPYQQTRFRYQLNATWNPLIQTKTQIDLVSFRWEEEKRFGYAVSQSLSLAKADKPWKVDAGLAYFNASDWETRIYAYEKNILYGYGGTNYYGEGIRAYALLAWKYNKTTLNLKLSNTHYFDRTESGSGADLIEGRDRTLINFLVRFAL